MVRVRDGSYRLVDQESVKREAYLVKRFRLQVSSCGFLVVDELETSNSKLVTYKRDTFHVLHSASC